MSLHYSFPIIQNLSDVLPHVDDNFRMIEKDGLVFINYNHIAVDVFPQILPGESRVAKELAHRAAVKRELRGIAFNALSGELVSRPLHKFFNLGERPDTGIEYLGPTSEHLIVEKLDGSMVRPLLLPGVGLRWGTKMGVTDTALLAEEYVAGLPQYREAALHCLENGLTPIFEFCSPRARIVEEYAEEKLVLLAVRRNLSGEYYSRVELLAFGQAFALPVVEAFGKNYDTERLVMHTRMLDKGEGVVLQIGGGHAVKIKAEQYVKLHKAKDQMRSEADLLDLVYAEKLDDVLPLLSPPDQDNVWAYLTQYRCALDKASETLRDHYEAALSLYADKKDFAINSPLEQPWKGRVLDLMNGKFASPRDVIERQVTKLLSFGEPGTPGFHNRATNSTFAAMRAAYALHTGWEVIMEGKAKA